MRTVYDVLVGAFGAAMVGWGLFCLSNDRYYPCRFGYLGDVGVYHKESGIAYIVIGIGAIVYAAWKRRR